MGETTIRRNLTMLEAAQDYIEAAAEAADVILHPEDLDELSVSLRNRTIAVLGDAGVNFDD